jgi:hypothetical protein
MYYEVELCELFCESDGAGGLQVMGLYWKLVRMFNKDAILIPLTFDASCAAQVIGKR